MRPIDRGKPPVDEQGRIVHFTKYEEARPELISRLGELCSYCEMHLDAGLAVEHIQPKSRQPQHEMKWENLLLACVNCNSIKHDQDIHDQNIDDYLWPDKNNTFLALAYSEGGMVTVQQNLPEEIRLKAQRLIELVALDRNPATNSTASDRRWSNRRDEWEKAKRAKYNLERVDTKEMRAQILDTAEAYFSVWMTVFADDEEMRKALIRKFRGTAKDCFDHEGKPIPRNDVI